MRSIALALLALMILPLAVANAKVTITVVHNNQYLANANVYLYAPNGTLMAYNITDTSGTAIFSYVNLTNFVAVVRYQNIIIVDNENIINTSSLKIISVSMNVDAMVNTTILNVNLAFYGNKTLYVPEGTYLFTFQQSYNGYVFKKAIVNNVTYTSNKVNVTAPAEVIVVYEHAPIYISPNTLMYLALFGVVIGSVVIAVKKQMIKRFAKPKYFVKQ